MHSWNLTALLMPAHNKLHDYRNDKAVGLIYIWGLGEGGWEETAYPLNMNDMEKTSSTSLELSIIAT